MTTSFHDLRSAKHFPSIVANCLKKYAVEFDLNLDLICAVIHVESSGNPWASRFEPAFYEKYIKGKKMKDLPGYFPPIQICTPQTENFNRSRSMGLFQVMGNTARLYGYDRPFLDELFDIPTNIYMGCKILADKIKDRQGDTEKGLLAYNGGGDPRYPDRVMSTIRAGKAEYLLAV
jgi:soluble lytic murein transglycosylase-like protein